MFSDALRHELERPEYKGWMTDAALVYVALMEKEHISIGRCDGRCWVGSAIEDRHVGNDRASSIDMHHLFPAIRVVLKDAHLAADNHKKSFDRLSVKKQHLSLGEVQIHRLLGKLREFLHSQTAKQYGVLQSRDSFCFHCILHNIVIMT